MAGKERPHLPLTRRQQRLVNRATKFVYARARCWAKPWKHHHELYEQLVDEFAAEGMVGVCIAAKLFQPRRGYKFLTYATGWIDQKIQRALANLDDVSPGWARIKSRLKTKPRLHANGDQRLESDGPKVVRIGMFDFKGNFEGAAPEGIDPPARPESTPDNISDRCVAIAKLIPDARNRRIFLMRTVGKMTLAEIGRMMGITRERVRQIYVKERQRLRRLPQAREMWRQFQDENDK